MRRVIMLAVAISLSAFGAGCGGSSSDGDLIVPDDATLTVSNDSSFVIDALHLTDVDSTNWGPNLIPEALFPGESVTITEVACSHYDVLVTDETGLDCVLSDVSLCFADHFWSIDDGMLDACAFSKPSSPRIR